MISKKDCINCFTKTYIHAKSENNYKLHSHVRERRYTLYLLASAILFSVALTPDPVVFKEHKKKANISKL